MKQSLYISLFAIILTALTVQRFDSRDLTQMVVTLPGLNSKALQRDLEADIYNLSGIQFIETSLMSKTLILNYDAHKVTTKEVDHILHKWGCIPGESSFQNIVSMK